MFHQNNIIDEGRISQNSQITTIVINNLLIKTATTVTTTIFMINVQEEHAEMVQRILTPHLARPPD
jgi:hypothetical protein